MTPLVASVIILIISTLVGLVLTAYGFIFKSQLARIKKLEERPLCDTKSCILRFNKIELEQTSVQPILLEIREKLVSIETFLQLLKDGQININK